MKKVNQILLATALLLTGSMTTSCDLDREPQQALDKDRALLSYTDAQAWQSGLKHRLRLSIGGYYTATQDIQADELTATLEFGNNYGAFADWSQLQAGTYETRDTYAGYYTTIKNANYVIEYLPRLLEPGSTVSADEQAKLKVILGEAYFHRAYAYLNLAIRYGKSYVEASAATDLSVPLHLKYNFEAKPPRESNKVIYDQVLADLTAAATNLSTVAGVANTDNITIDAVKALRARTCLYMQKYAEALALANELTASPTYALMSPSADNMSAMWYADGTALKESILMPAVSFPEEENRTLSGVYLGANNQKSAFVPNFLPTKAVYDLFDATDTRKGVYFWAGETLIISGKNYTDLVLVGKWRGNAAYATTANARWGKVPDGRMRPKILRLAEQYLIAAEAAYRTGGDALTPLNALRASRGLAPVSVSGADLLREIKLERQRELAFEGFRLFDLKRWGDDVVRANPQTSAVGVPIVERLATVRHQAGNNKFTWPMPYQDIQVGGLVQNPGY